MEPLAAPTRRHQAETTLRARVLLPAAATWLPLPQWLLSSSAAPLRDRQAERVFPTPQDLRSPNRPPRFPSPAMRIQQRIDATRPFESAHFQYENRLTLPSQRGYLQLSLEDQ